MATHVVGYSQTMQSDESRTLAALGAIRKITEEQIGKYRGRIANTAGGIILAEFGSAIEAVSCAIHLQDVLADQSLGRRDLQVRIGIHIGDIVARTEIYFGRQSTMPRACKG
jgi:adenylate cyclase